VSDRYIYSMYWKQDVLFFSWKKENKYVWMNEHQRWYNIIVSLSSLLLSRCPCGHWLYCLLIYLYDLSRFFFVYFILILTHFLIIPIYIKWPLGMFIQSIWMSVRCQVITKNISSFYLSFFFVVKLSIKSHDN